MSIGFDVTGKKNANEILENGDYDFYVGTWGRGNTYKFKEEIPELNPKMKYYRPSNSFVLDDTFARWACGDVYIDGDDEMGAKLRKKREYFESLSRVYELTGKRVLVDCTVSDSDVISRLREVKDVVLVGDWDCYYNLLGYAKFRVGLMLDGRIPDAGSLTGTTVLVVESDLLKGADTNELIFHDLGSHRLLEKVDAIVCGDYVQKKSVDRLLTR